MDFAFKICYLPAPFSCTIISKGNFCMQPTYKHRQAGSAILALMLIPLFAFAVILVLVAPRGTLFPLLLFLLVMLLIAYGFSSLTVEVDAEKVLLYFGPGFISRTIPIEAIDNVRVVRNAFWMGLGIHFIRGGIIYNVSGLDGIEITLKDGRLVRIGSDEPETLARAVEDAVSAYVHKR